MINFVRGTPEFVARLSPVLNPKHEYLLNIILDLVKTIHKAGGYVFSVVTNNLSVNQKAFKILREMYTPHNICSVEHPIENTNFPDMYILYDTTH